jgi:aspartyl-tRNA(Asn)/glutamyl-tRNA(Gln) amidotransferase subunit A
MMSGHGSGSGSTSTSAGRDGSTPFYNLTIAEASALIEAGELSPVELVESILERIEQVEPQIQAWVTILSEEALQAARIAEQAILKGERIGPLHGIPFGAKDLYYTAGIRTTAGSKVAADFVPTTDATVITRLKQAGAILLGKTTTTEYAFFGGAPATRNPWNRAHSPGGSSSGSAAALASSMAMFTLGTQTAGSLSRPAAYNGLTTLKATYGRVSRAGIIAASWSLDHAGAFTRTAEDAAIVLQAIAGYDELDPTSIRSVAPNYRKALSQDSESCGESSMKGMVVGVAKEFFYDQVEQPELIRAVEQAIEVYQRLGAQIVPVSLPPSFKDAQAAHRIVMRVEAASYHQDHYDSSAHLYTPELRELLELGRATPALDYLRAQRIRSVYRKEMVGVLEQVDALLTPAAQGQAPEGQSFTGSPLLNAPFTNAGVPTIVHPIGFAAGTGLPFGLQLAARPHGEERLIRLCHAYQSVTNWHQARPELRG